jgi:uncharacterized membrane protein
MKIKSIYWVSLIMLLVGAIITHLYLYMVDVSTLPFFVLIIGIGIQSASFLILTYKTKTSNNKFSPYYYIFYILVLSISIVFMKNTRFQVWGTDILEEKNVAKNTFSNQYWNTTLIKSSNFVSSLEVTILPAILAEITGMSIDAIFNTIMAGIVASIPVFLFLIIHSITNNRDVAFLSSALFAQNYFFFTIYPNIIKYCFAILFMLLTIYSYVIARVKGKKYVLLGVLFSLGVVISHYTTILLFAYILLFFIILWFLYKSLWKHQLRKQLFSYIYLVMYLTIAFSWLIFIAYPTFNMIFYNVGRKILASLLSANFGIKSPTIQYSLNPPQYRDLSVTVWFDLQNVAIGFSAFLAFVGLVRGKIGKGEDEWTIMGLASIILVIIWVLLPGFSTKVYPERILSFSMLFSSYFLASFLSKCMKKGKLLVQFIVAVFLILMLPMNLMLPSHGTDPLFHSVSSFTPERALNLQSTGYRTDTDKVIVNWVVKYIKISKPIYVDYKGKYTSILSPFPHVSLFIYSQYPNSAPDSFIFLHILYIEYNLWAFGSLSVINFNRSIDSSIFFQPPYDIVYDSAENKLAFHPG